MTEPPPPAEDDSTAGKSTANGDESRNSDELIRRARSEAMPKTEPESLVADRAEGEGVDAPPSTEPAEQPASILDGLQEPESAQLELRGARAAGYRSSASRGRLVQVLLGFWVVISSVAAGVSLIDYRIVSRLIENPLSVSVAAVNENADRGVAIGVLWLLALVVTGIAFIAWMLRVYDNLKPMTAAAPRYSRGWVIGGWLVPFLNLWRPKQIMDDLWRANDPVLPVAEDLIAGAAWQGKPVSPLLHLWWALWIIGGLLGYVLGRSDISDLDDSRLFSAVDTLGNLFFAAAAIAAFLVVTRLTERQEVRASHVFAGYAVAHPYVARRSSALVAGVLGVAGGIVFAGVFLSLDASAERADVAEQAAETTVALVPSADVSESPNSTATALPGIPTLLEDLDPGDCWNSPDTVAGAEQLLAVDVVPCDQSHLGELFFVATFPGSSAMDFAGDEQVFRQSQRLCIEQFEATFESSYESSPFDVFYFLPTSSSWAAGDRAVKCSVTTNYLDPISGPAPAVHDELPGNDLAVLTASSCGQITDAMVINAQLAIDVFGSLTADQWSSVETSGAVPEIERMIKRDALMDIRAYELGCSLAALNVLFLDRIDELETNTFDGQAILASFNDGGYWDESLAP